MKTEQLSISTEDKIALIISLATMLSAGITIIEAVDSLLEDTKGNQKKILTTFKEDISQGKRMYTAFAKFPQVFDKVTVNIIKASEEAGTLNTTLKQIKENIQKESEFLDKVKGALMYPVFILFVFIGVLGMILIVVIPKISTVFLQLKVQLPLPTKILIFLSGVITKQTIPLVITVTILITTLVLLLKYKKKLLMQALFSLPGVHGLIIQIDLVRFTRSLAMLYNSGIIITTSLELCEEIVLDKQVAQMVKDSKNAIMSGKNFADSLRVHKKLVPSIMIKIIEAGEKSGYLYQSLQEISDYLDYTVSKTLKTLTALIEPVMLVFVGILVGGMMISIIAPIYGLIGQVGAP